MNKNAEVNRDEISITFLHGFQDELNMSAEKYYNFYRSNNFYDLRYALKSIGDACIQGFLFLLKTNDIIIYKKNGHTIEIKYCILLLETVLKSRLTHKAEVENLILIRNKLVHNETKISIRSACNFMDKAFYSLMTVFDENSIDITQYIRSQEHRTFIKQRESYYKKEVSQFSVLLNKDNYLHTRNPILNCPFCGEEDSFYLKGDETKYRCALCEVEDDAAHCCDCATIVPSALLLDFCEGYEDLCENCYEYHANKFSS